MSKIVTDTIKLKKVVTDLPKNKSEEEVVSINQCEQFIVVSTGEVRLGYKSELPVYLSQVNCQ